MVLTAEIEEAAVKAVVDGWIGNPNTGYSWAGDEGVSIDRPYMETLLPTGITVPSPDVSGYVNNIDNDYKLINLRTYGVKYDKKNQEVVRRVHEYKEVAKQMIYQVMQYYTPIAAASITTPVHLETGMMFPTAFFNSEFFKQYMLIDRTNFYELVLKDLLGNVSKNYEKKGLVFQMQENGVFKNLPIAAPIRSFLNTSSEREGTVLPRFKRVMDLFTTDTENVATAIMAGYDMVKGVTMSDAEYKVTHEHICENTKIQNIHADVIDQVIICDELNVRISLTVRQDYLELDVSLDKEYGRVETFKNKLKELHYDVDGLIPRFVNAYSKLPELTYVQEKSPIKLYFRKNRSVGYPCT